MTNTNGAALTNGHKPDQAEVLVVDDAEEIPAAEAADVTETTEADGADGATEADGADGVTEADGATDAAAPTPDGKAPRNWRRLMIRVFAGILVVAVLGGVGYAGWLMYRQHQLDTASRDALHAAEKYAVVLTSIDTNAIDQNFSDVLDGSTGEFKDMYSKSSTQLRQLLVDNKAAAHGTVLEAAVQSVTPDEVVVLLFVDQSITNSAVPDPRIDRSRIKMTMDKVDGRWLAGKVELP